MRSFFGSDVEEETEEESPSEPKKRNIASTSSLIKLDLGEVPSENAVAKEPSGIKKETKELTKDETPAKHDEFSPIKRHKVSVIVKEEPTDSVEETGKRRRGRPKKNESVPREMTVTRKSSRIVDKIDTSSKNKSNTTTGAKPLRVMHFDQLLTPTDNSDSQQSSGNLPLSDQSRNMTDAASIPQHQGNRRNRHGLPNTLDVLIQFVKEHTAKPKINDTVNEAMILSEYRLHLISSLEHLRDLHLDIADISNDVYEVQRKKNEVRRKILEVKKEHATTLENIDGVKCEYDNILKSHREFMATVNSLQALKKAIDSETPQEDSELSTNELLSVYSGLIDPEWGLASQLRSVNTKLSSMLEDTDEEE